MMFLLMYIHTYVPEQVDPFPVYPVLQVQLYPPCVFVQLALSSHAFKPSLHSSVSESRVRIISEQDEYKLMDFVTNSRYIH